MAHDDGGPAYPRRPYVGQDARGIVEDDAFTSGHKGMSLWDHYYGQAMTGLLASGNFAAVGPNERAVMAGDIAAAMVAEKRRREKNE